MCIRDSYYRRHRRGPAPPRLVVPRRPQPRALSEAEQTAVLEVLHHPDHVDEAPATVYAKLLDEGTYLASTSTMYRLLRANAEVRERRRQATHPAAKKPVCIRDRDRKEAEACSLLPPVGDGLGGYRLSRRP